MANPGMGLAKLSDELTRQRTSRHDYLAKTEVLSIVPGNGLRAPTPPDERVAMQITNGKRERFGITALGHDQLGQYVGIPAAYYDRMLAERPDLLADNVNGWLSEKKEKRLIRTLDGRVRAVLSDRYRALDNFDLMKAVLPVLDKRKVQVISASVTETRLYVKAILPDLSEPLPAGRFWLDGHSSIGTDKRESRIVAAITISNSEVGAGALAVVPSVFETWCTNLATMREAAMRKYHVGRALDNGDGDTSDIYKDDTRKADDRALWLKVRDVTEAAFAKDQFALAIGRIKGAVEEPIESDDLPAVIEVLGKEFDLPEALDKVLLKNLIQRADTSRWGLVSAVTMSANKQTDYELATDLEEIGGTILNDDRVWKTIATAGEKPRRTRKAVTA